MRCQELMKTHVECARPNDSIQHAAEVMKEKGIGFLPVCDEQDRVLGTLTDRDIVIRCVATGKSLESTCQDVMTNEVVACRPDDDISECEEHMASRHKSRMLICDADDKLVGVISLSDIAQHERSRKAGKTLRAVTSREAQKASF